MEYVKKSGFRKWPLFWKWLWIPRKEVRYGPELVEGKNPNTYVQTHISVNIWHEKFMKRSIGHFFFENPHFWGWKKIFKSKSNWFKMMLKVYILVQNCFPSLIGCISGQNSYFRPIVAELRFFEKIDF